jgi:hypothetical protein
MSVLRSDPMEVVSSDVSHATAEPYDNRAPNAAFLPRIASSDSENS